MTDANNTRITGKQVLCDAVTLLKDTGTFIFELGKTVFFKVKSLVKNAEEKDGESNKHE